MGSRIAWAGVAVAWLACSRAPSVAPTAAVAREAVVVSEATPDEICGYFAGIGRDVVTFLGYSGAGYEDEQAMLAEAGRILDAFDPRRTIVNVGGTEEGIGAVYPLAKAKGFTTTGVVSTRARDEGVRLSPAVDRVFYVRDATWGGRDGQDLSPTSRAVVECSDHVIAIGGGAIARDELEAAKRAGKRVRFVPADMDHEVAREKARKRGEPPPTDFRSLARTVL